MSSVQMSNWELARLLSTGEGMRYPLKNGLNTLGGRSRNDISFVSAYCSNGHCNIRVEASGVSLDDHVSYFCYAYCIEIWRNMENK